MTEFETRLLEEIRMTRSALGNLLIALGARQNMRVEGTIDLDSEPIRKAIAKAGWGFAEMAGIIWKDMGGIPAEESPTPPWRM